jgi:GNAT superfamily N-acetyltransferase
MTHPSVAPLLAGLDEEYLIRYGPNEEMARTHAEEFDPPEGCFVVLLHGEITAAGGGYRLHSPGTCEVKRMWTHPDYRRRGLAAQVLTDLETRASKAGYERLILETGPRQPEAISFYENRGYRRIPYFGIYEEAHAFEFDL